MFVSSCLRQLEATHAYHFFFLWPHRVITVLISGSFSWANRGLGVAGRRFVASRMVATRPLRRCVPRCSGRMPRRDKPAGVPMQAVGFQQAPHCPRDQIGYPQFLHLLKNCKQNKNKKIRPQLFWDVETVVVKGVVGRAQGKCSGKFSGKQI